jgi:TIR domain
MSQPTAVPSHVFVSHSHADNDFCRRLVQTLRNTGLSVWYDEQNLSAGYLTSTIERELRQADAFLVVLSPAAVESQWVQSEWYAAWDLAREGKDDGTIRLWQPL